MAIVPEYIGKYKISSVVAVGGMGTVYKAVHPSLNRDVIIKKLTLKNGGSITRERFRREARILLEISSPYVVRMFDYFTEGRSDFIVLEFVDGMSLDKLLQKQKALPPELALLIFLDCCYGLKNAHAKGIVHRDIKPGNILISKRAEVKLADFGIASTEKETDIQSKDEISLSADELKKGITMAGSTLGTPAYMSPEQFDDSSAVDHRADLYSMGVMLYEMLTGTKPYSGDMSKKTIAKIRKGDYISPRKLDRRIPRGVCSIIKKLMKPQPRKRYRSVESLIPKVKRFLKKYDAHAVRVTLAKAVLSPKPLEIKPVQPKKNYGLRAALILAGAAAAGCLFAFCWNRGYIHKVFLRAWFTPVTISLSVPGTSGVEADLPSKAFFFYDEEGIPEVPGKRTEFTRIRDGKLVSEERYLVPGEYRVKVVSGPAVWWKSFTVQEENVTLDFSFSFEKQRHLEVKLSVTDHESGRNISGNCLLEVMSGGKYTELDEETASSLKTGAVHKFRVSCPGYKAEEYSLLLDWYQDSLNISASLKKEELQ